MAEWHITPDYIVNNWTDELLDLMVEKLIERKTREQQAMKGKSTEPNKISDTELFNQARNKIKVVKSGNKRR